MKASGRGEFSRLVEDCKDVVGGGLDQFATTDWTSATVSPIDHQGIRLMRHCVIGGKARQFKDGGRVVVDEDRLFIPGKTG